MTVEEVYGRMETLSWDEGVGICDDEAVGVGSVESVGDCCPF